MKVLNICSHDWANYSHDNANALRSVGVYCVDLKRYSHGFSYLSQSKRVDTNFIRNQISHADVIQIMHSDTTMLELVRQYKGQKKIVVYHTGTGYRQNYKKYNQLFDSVVDMAITDQCEFMFLYAKNLHYLATAVNIERIKADDYQTRKPLKITHYPSNPEIKGTDDIIRMVKQVHRGFPKFNFHSIDLRVTNQEQLNRMRDCDVYIELFKPVLNGNPYGCYGVTAFEAAALGKIVVTQNIYPNVYTDTYGVKCPFIICNTEREFIYSITALVKMDVNAIQAMKQQTRMWIEQYHSYRATGNKLRTLLSI